MEVVVLTERHVREQGGCSIDRRDQGVVRLRDKLDEGEVVRGVDDPEGAPVEPRVTE